MEMWNLTFTDYDPEEELLRETLMTLGNGYFATRGAAEESSACENHYPATYLSGGYNRLISTVAGREVENEDLVNWPNWLLLKFRVNDEEWFDLKNVEILFYVQNLDMKNGEMTRKVHFVDKKGRESKLHCSRFVSMDHPHIGGIKWTLTPVNWSGKIEICSSLDGSVINAGVERYKSLNSKHLVVRNGKKISNQTLLLETFTSQSQIVMAQAVRTKIFINGIYHDLTPDFVEWPEVMSFHYHLDVRRESEVTVEKILALYTSRDRAISNCTYESIRLIGRVPDYDVLLTRHRRQWDLLWELCDIELPGKIRQTRLLRLHIFHLLQTVSLKSIDLDVGVPARGLHGEAYRGHIFWDELFILPFLNLRIPELSRSLLLYRYRRLDEARINAEENGFKGALFPWQSGSNGEEESQILHLNPRSGRWIPDATSRQRHINAAVLYNIWQYFQATGDKDFLSHFGVEMAIEICRFWVSAMSWNPERGRYDINNVVGPDEFHTRYPGGEENGINNNAYTNFMASWCIRTTINLFLSLAVDRQDEILNSLEVERKELREWQEMSKLVYLPLDESGILHQFEGFEKLIDLDWEYYRKKYGNIQRIDRILEAEGDDVNRYRVNKQSDVLMLYYLFSEEELKSGFQWMGYPFDPEWIKLNIDHHLALSSNGSTLSRIVHAWVLSRYDVNTAWKWFCHSLETDVADLQGGTSHEGIHLGAMAGTVDLVQRCFTGVKVANDVLWIDPKLPEELTSLELLIHFRGQSLEISIDQGKMKVRVKRSWMQTGKIGIKGQILNFKEGDVLEFSDEEARWKPQVIKTNPAGISESYRGSI